MILFKTPININSNIVNKINSFIKNTNDKKNIYFIGNIEFDLNKTNIDLWNDINCKKSIIGNNINYNFLKDSMLIDEMYWWKVIKEKNIILTIKPVNINILNNNRLINYYFNDYKINNNKYFNIKNFDMDTLQL